MACDAACALHCAYFNRPVTPYVLRHTFAVTAVQKGISLLALQGDVLDLLMQVLDWEGKFITIHE
jgi:hypothetical protein